VSPRSAILAVVRLDGASDCFYSLSLLLDENLRRNKEKCPEEKCPEEKRPEITYRLSVLALVY
jgi:hypothetical protein